MRLPNLAGIAGSAVLYPVIYMLFGFFVAYGSEATRTFYANTSLGGSPELSGELILIGFQIFRGALWAVCCLPVAALVSRREELVAILGVGLPVFTALKLINNNPLMPEAVRYAHGFELAMSMTLFGIALGFLLGKPNELVENRGS
jgi:hypothetical protein